MFLVVGVFDVVLKWLGVRWVAKIYELACYRRNSGEIRRFSGRNVHPAERNYH